MINHIPTIKEKLASSKNIVISTHVSPDGDAVGSSLGLYHYLKTRIENVAIIVPNDFPDFLKWLSGTDEIVVFNKEEDKAKKLIANADVIFSLDYNETKRTAFVKEDIDASPAFKILIDHHLGDPSWQDINLSTVGASSTCELVLDFLEHFVGDASFMNVDIAYGLYTGLLTDTGNFQFSATSAKVHLQAAKLIEAGVKPDVVNNHINNSYNEERLQFFGYCISEKMKIIPEKKLAYTFITTDELHRFNIQNGGTEGLVNEPMKIADIDVSILFKEDDGKVKISFRSKRDIDISAFASKYFSGGGHRNAAGGISFKGVEETEADFLSYLEEFNIS